MHSPLAPTAHLHNVVSLYISVLNADCGRCLPSERQLAVELAHRWEPAAALADVEAVVDTACSAARSGLSTATPDVAKRFSETLSLRDRRRLLSELGRLARADGHLTRREAKAIALARCLLLADPRRPSIENGPHAKPPSTAFLVDAVP